MKGWTKACCVLCSYWSFCFSSWLVAVVIVTVVTSLCVCALVLLPFDMQKDVSGPSIHQHLADFLQHNNIHRERRERGERGEREEQSVVVVV